MHPAANTSNSTKAALHTSHANSVAPAAEKNEMEDEKGVQVLSPQSPMSNNDKSCRKAEFGFEGRARSAELESSLNSANPISAKGWSKLGATDREKLNEIMKRAQGAGAQKALTGLGASQKFHRLSPYLQQKVLETAAGDPKGLKSDALQGLVESNGFQKLAPRHQIDALEVFQKCDANGCKIFVDLANCSITKNRNSTPALMDPDSRGTMLIENLHHMAMRDLSPYMMNSENARQRLLSSVMQEAAKPGEIEQGNHGTCTVTTMQYMLCSQNPSEYTRIMDGLSTTGQVILRNGETLTRVNDSMADDASVQRSPSERLFQAAMMDYCNGERRYSNKIDEKSGFDCDIQKNGKRSVASLSDTEAFSIRLN
ncbi:hypothetical protein L0222_26465 [bacterium]|nr:hypothetical protein [bacterium]MCI0605753.1 hypothetical protein [bacterium]